MTRGIERGFTLLELVVTTGVLIALAGFAALLLRPANLIAERMDARRYLGTAAIVQGVNRYVAYERELPVYVPDKQTAIGTGNDEYDICLLTAAYLPEAPLDPQRSVAADADGKTIENAGSVDCDNIEITYKSGFTIQKQDDYVVVSATLSDGKKFTLRSIPFNGN